MTMRIFLQILSQPRTPVRVITPISGISYTKFNHSSYDNIEPRTAKSRSCVRFDGVSFADEILKDVRNARPLISFNPKLVPIVVGDNCSSQIYVSRKVKAGKRVGIDVDPLYLPSNISQTELLCMIKNLNKDHGVNGIIIQLPLPSHLNEQILCNSIVHTKDVDGFTAHNLGFLIQGANFHDIITPCTPLAVKLILDNIFLEKKILDTKGLRAVVLGRSTHVGLPIAIILQSSKLKGGFDMTTKICHRYTSDIASEVCGADVVVSAVGIPDLIRADMIKPGAIVIDVGITRLDNNKIVGDVSSDVINVASLVTPVPGGVGPCTVACLMKNTFKAASLQHKL